MMVYSQLYQYMQKIWRWFNGQMKMLTYWWSQKKSQRVTKVSCRHHFRNMNVFYQNSTATNSTVVKQRRNIQVCNLCEVLQRQVDPSSYSQSIFSFKTCGSWIFCCYQKQWLHFNSMHFFLHADRICSNPFMNAHRTQPIFSKQGDGWKLIKLVDLRGTWVNGPALVPVA